MVLSLADAVAIFNEWKEDSAEILVVIESPFQQSRRGILEQGIDRALGAARPGVGGVNRSHQKRKEGWHGCLASADRKSLAEYLLTTSNNK